MTDKHMVPAPQKSRQQLQVRRASKPRGVTGALKTACDLMVWGGKEGIALPWDEAARQANYTVRSMRLALERPHVRRYLNEQKVVFAAQASASNVSHAVALRSSSPNQQTRLGAIRLIEDIAGQVDSSLARPHAKAAGIVIVIAPPQAQPPAGQLIEHDLEPVDPEP